MQLGPEPLPAPLEDHVEEHRHLFCRSYDACLNQAAHENWESWSCAHCVRFQPLRQKGERRPAERTSRIQQADATPRAPACGGDAGERPVGRSRAGARSPSPARHGDVVSRQGVSHSLEEEHGTLHLRLEAPSMLALFVEAARAVAEAIRGRPLEPPAGWAEEVSIAAPDPDRLLVEWIAELVRRSVRAKVRFEELDIVYLSDCKVVASIRGVRLGEIHAAPEPHAYSDPRLVERPGHVTAEPVLEI